MTSPKTPKQLADAIENVVALQLDEVRRSVQHAGRTFVIEICGVDAT